MYVTERLLKKIRDFIPKKRSKGGKDVYQVGLKPDTNFPGCDLSPTAVSKFDHLLKNSEPLLY